jgi:hypothetical protein
MQVKLNSSLSFSFLLLFTLEAFSQGFDQKSTDIGNIGLSISNVGTVGRPNVKNDTKGPPSMEYPLNSGVEHLFEGGLWIGAYINGQIAVSTASLDDATGYSTGKAGFEFTPMGPITIRSRLPYSDSYTSSAVSHQDFQLRFTDSNLVVPGTSIVISGHTLPLKAVVKLESYAWNYAYADFFVVLNYEITNSSLNTWDSVFTGMWTDLVVRNVNVTQDNGTAFFNKGGGGFLDSLTALYAYEVTGDDIQYTQSYGAVQFLGIEWRDKFFHPVNSSAFTGSGLPKPEVNANFWDYKSAAPGPNGAPQDENQRYYKLSNGLDFTDPNITNPLKTASNKTQLLSAGPLLQLLPGEKIKFTLAMVCARQVNGPADTEAARARLKENLEFARKTYLGEDENANGNLDSNEDLNNNQLLDRFVLPEPPATPKVKIVPSANKVDIYWDRASVSSMDPISRKQDFEGYRVYMTKPGEDLVPGLLDKAHIAGTWDSTGNSIGFNNGFSAIALPAPVKFEDDTTSYHFHYQVNGLLNGWQYLFIVTAFDKGDVALGLASLESSLSENSFSVYSGTEAIAFEGTNDNTEVGVYPNPYKTTAAWDGSTSRTRKIYFYNLPAHSRITIYNIAGDVVNTIEHNAETYKGEDIRWYENFSGGRSGVFPGGEHAWDLLSSSKASISQGLYLFAVKDLDTGIIKTGKFAILK